ncbi:MAG: hypothetical protein V4615_05780 [Bacteroidota bacterium]
MKAATSTFSNLATEYGVTVRTLKRWLSDYKDLNIKHGQKILTPKQVRLIFDKIGEP